MTWHDHGSWVGPCSADKHAVLVTGIKRRYQIDQERSEVRQEPWEDSMKRAIEFCVFVDGVGMCACCRMEVAPRKPVL